MAGNPVYIADPVDELTSVPISLTQTEAEINNGNHYYVSGYETEGSGGTIEFVIVTPDTSKRAHMTFWVSGIESTTIEVYEGASGVSGGSSATPTNNNRNSANTAGCAVTKDPDSITSDGTLIDSYKVGVSGSYFSSDAPGIARREKKLILKQNETYLFRITSNGAGNVISYKGSWYEK